MDPIGVPADPETSGIVTDASCCSKMGIPTCLTIQ